MRVYQLLFLFIFTNAIITSEQKVKECSTKIPTWMGKSMKALGRRIVGGNAAPEPIPWQAHITIIIANQPFLCGGTILDEETILSASHCFSNFEAVYVETGIIENPVPQRSFVVDEKSSNVKEIIRHPSYISSDYDNDIALLKLKKPLKFDNYTQPACLPDTSLPPQDGQLSVVSGWGETGAGKGKTLNYVVLPVVSNEDCINWSSAYKDILTDKMVCAGYEKGKKDSCRGDSGGPLIINGKHIIDKYDDYDYDLDGLGAIRSSKIEDSSKATLYGIVSFGPNRCGKAGVPGVYTRVSSYTTWILSHMKGKSEIDGSCYGAETPKRQFCKNCSDVQEAYEDKNWKFIPSKIEQCDTGVCVDKNSLCPGIASVGGCDSNSEFLDQCPKSCGQCKVSQDNVPKTVEIARFHVKAQIQMRYAKSEIELKIQNPTREVEETSFGICIPEKATVSSFSMTINDKNYQAKVKSKEEAEKIFAQEIGNKGLISNSGNCSDDTKFIKYDIKLKAGEEVTFYLTYEEYLFRHKGDRFHYKLSVPPNDIGTDDFRISVSIKELANLFRVNIQRDDKDFTKNATISYNYDTGSDEIAMNLGKDIGRTFDLSYSLEREDGHIFDIGGSKFIHSFLQSDPRHIIFVIDVSGSMVGSKQEDLIDALSTIIGAIKNREKHYINIVSFNDTVEIWPKNERGRTNGQNGHLKQAYEYILNLEFKGNTNINQALLDALEIAKNTRREKTKKKINAADQFIVFLTDGNANVGITRTSEILDNIKKSQIKDEFVRIHGIAFGENADWNLVQGIAKQNNGSAEKISDKESDQSYMKIEDFTLKILERNDYHFNYNINGKAIGKEKLNKTGIDPYESVIYGESKDGNAIKEAIVNIVNTESGWKGEPIDMCTSAEGGKRCSEKSSKTSNKVIERDYLIERIRAQNRIKWLLAEENRNCKYERFADCKTEALNLALKYEFVTPLTSLIVEESNEYITSEIIEENSLSQTSPSQDYYNDYDSECKVTLYIQTHLRGKRKIVTTSLGNLGEFNNEVASLKVEGDCSVTFYSEPNFKGEEMTFQAGSYEKALQLKKVFKKASSVNFSN